MRLSVQPRRPRSNLSAVQVKNPRLSRDKVANRVIITRVDPDSQVGVIHSLLDQGDGGSSTTLVVSIRARRPRVLLGGGGVDGLLDISTVQIVGSVDIEDTVREGVGDVTGTLLVTELFPQLVDVLSSGDSPLVTVPAGGELGVTQITGISKDIIRVKTLGGVLSFSSKRLDGMGHQPLIKKRSLVDGWRGEVRKLVIFFFLKIFSFFLLFLFCFGIIKGIFTNHPQHRGFQWHNR